jgi:general secretion pathway protein E
MMSEAALREFLVGRELLSAAEFEEALRVAQDTGRPLDRVLLERELLSEIELLTAFGEVLEIPVRQSLAGVTVPAEFTEKVPLHFARRYNVVQVGRHDGLAEVATSSPLDLHPLDDLAMILGMEVEAVLAPTNQVLSLIDRAYEDKSRMGGIVDHVLEELSETPGRISVEPTVQAEDLLDIGDKAPVIRLVRQTLYEAFQVRASDVHIQPREDDCLVRFRIDGILYDRFTFPKALQDSVVSRVKVMGYLDIAEKRLPQDGRTSMTIRDREIDLRISCVPTCFGERLVIRLLDKGSRVLGLEDIGLLPDDLEKIARIIQYSHGVIFITGPTGSGKTTTLYGILSRINSAEKNVITIEDPIEYRLRNISQIQVATEKGLSFASGLRSILRQDPDIIMVGEVRDLETARIAIQSALTGHLVFSTIHTNDSAGALTRLLDIGIEPYLVSSAMVGVVAQRLVRLICPACKEPYEPAQESLRELGVSHEQLPEGVLYRGRGCSDCMQTGYFGRTGIYELFVIDEEARTQVMDQWNASTIKRSALERGLRTLRMDGARKVVAGKTTAEEVLRVTQMDEL